MLGGIRYVSMGHQEFFRLFPAKCELKRAGFDVNLGLDLPIEMGVWPTRACVSAHRPLREQLRIRVSFAHLHQPVHDSQAVEHAGFKLVGAELIRRPADARERRHDLWGEVR